MSVAPVDSSFYEKLLENPESEIEAMLQIRSNFLDPSLRPDYLKTIQSLANDILSKISEMMRHGRPREEIYQLQKDSFQRLKSVEELFANQNAVFERMTTVQRERFRSNQDKIKGTTLDSAPDWAKAQMADELLIGMGMFRAAGFVIEKAEEGLQVFNDSVRLACEANPLMPAPFSAPLCLPTLAQMIPGSETFTKELKEAIPELPFVQRIQQDYDRAIQRMANIYERELGIPKEITTQFGADLPKVATTAALAGAAGGVLRVARLTPRISTAAVEILESDVGGMSIQKIKTRIARNHYEGGLAQEEKLVTNIKTKPAIQKTVNYPEHTNQFFSKCEVHPFKANKLGANGNGAIKGKLLYTQTEDGIFVVLQNRPTSIALRQRIGSEELVSSHHLYAHERVDHLVETALELASEKGVNSVSIAYDPKFHMVATALEKRSVNVIGQGTFSRGLYEKPLTVIQVEVPK